MEGEGGKRGRGRDGAAWEGRDRDGVGKEGWTKGEREGEMGMA